MSEAPPAAPRTAGGRGRGRRGGGGGDTLHSDVRPGDAGRGGGRRGGGRSGNRGAATGLGVDGNRIPAAAGDSGAAARLRKEKDADKSGTEGQEDDVEAEVCFICASPVVHNSVAPCNHRTCHICALRMRALYKTKDCAHCRTPAPFVIFTDDAAKRYEDFLGPDITFTDNNNGIRYENNEIMEDTILLLRYNCPDGDCDVACLGWPDLHRHVRAVHHKKICDLCSRHKKVFTHEHELFTDQELNKHMRKGDDNPGAIDQSGFKGHPECGFCRQRFYGDDELYVHCREKHERCFICDRRGGQPQYYVDYNSLELHYRKDHFLCPEQSCLDKKFIVFPSEIDLKAHQLEEHADTLSKDVRRDARVVDISSFDYRAPYIQERRGGSQREQREGRGRGRGRDPNVEAIPASSAQPLPRDQQAFQRQMAIHSAQSVSTRTFGGQLTSTPTPPAARAPAGTSQPPTITAPRPSSSGVERTAEALETLDLADMTPQDRARQLRHREVLERAGTLLQNDPSSMNRFRTLISSYRSASITAEGLIDSFFSLFSNASTSIGTLVREVADLFEDKAKADELRTAWNDWRAVNEDYPSLPGPSVPSGTLPLGWATTSTPSSSSGQKSTRVLKLKSSTAQSSRSSVSQTRSWGSASAAPTNSNKFAFPELPSASRAQTGRITTVPWTQSSSAPSSNPSSAPTSRPPSAAPGAVRSGGRGKPSADAFPSLPAAQKPQMTLFGYGSGRAVIRDPGKQSAGNAWGGSGTSSPQNGQSAAEDGEEGEGGKGKKKGNKGKKQVLMNWG